MTVHIQLLSQADLKQNSNSLQRFLRQNEF